MSSRPTNTQRNEVFRRAAGLCEYCQSQEKYSISTFEVEHILPVSKGGKTVLENLAFACSGCNKFKSDQTTSFDIDLQIEIEFYNPRRDIWSDHFVWNENLTEIIGLTDKGRITVKALKLNRKNLVNLRKVLVIVGEHLPKLKS